MVKIMNAFIKKLSLVSAVTLLTLTTAQNSFAELGELSDTPLFVSLAVEPNIHLTLDDSGSMDWEVMLQEENNFFSVNGGAPTVDGYRRLYWNPDWTNYMYQSDAWWLNDSAVIPPAEVNFGTRWSNNLWALRTHHVNTLYYNPEITYTPWPGNDASNNPMYSDAVPTAVLRDPTNAGAGTVDLTQSHDYFRSASYVTYNSSYYIPIYYEWIDSDNDGEVDRSDSKTMIKIHPSRTTYPSGRTYTEEMQNFANWFQYYRKREYSAKASVGGILAFQEGMRFGFGMINAGLKEYQQSITSQAVRANLLDGFYTTPSLPEGTPLRTALDRVGQYFSDTSSDAPILSASDGGECQQNFNILMTDGYWNGSYSGVGNADYSATDDNGFDGDETESIDNGNYEDGRSNTLADVAMHYYESDLRSDLNNEVPAVTGVDLAEHQHLVNFTIGFGVAGENDPDEIQPTDSSFAWPNPLDDEDLHRVDDLWHAAYNSRGIFLPAQNPIELENSLRNALSDILERSATAAAAAVTSSRLTTESIVYLAEFNTNRWRGTIYAHRIANLDTGNLVPTPEWSAADVLDARDLSNDPRLILTDNGGGVTFEWDNLNSDMQDDLRTNSLGEVDSDAIAQARLEYIRGARNQEGTGYNFRERATRLGDIVHSSPVFVSKPILRWPDEFPVNNPAVSYSTFKEANEDRTGVVYVGANDGMLHAFDGATGKELMAYIPSNLFSTNAREGLHYLTENNYSHKYYNDLTPSISDIFIDSAWHTVMIAGQGAGGRGYSALDVTNPALYSAANADDILLWEFNSDDDPDLGYTFSRPQIGMTNDGEWVAIFGNGYNQTGSEEAKLFIVKIAGGLDGSWDADDYTVISTGSTHQSGGANGLATPALADLDGNGTIDLAYAGDLNGDLWAFDLTSNATSNWRVAYNGTPLFNTESNLPITSKPILALHPSEPTTASNFPNVMVFFGSGQFMIDDDKTTTNDNYFYGVWDSGSSNLTRSNLIEQTYNSAFSVRVLSRNPVDYSVYYGWNISLPDSGERIITSPAVRGNTVIFNSSVPTGDACSTGGYGYRFIVDLATGGTPDEPVIDSNNSQTIDGDDVLDADSGLVQVSEQLSEMPTDNTFTDKGGFTGPNPFILNELPEPSTGRFSWQELILQ